MFTKQILLDNLQSTVNDIHHLCHDNHPTDDPFFTLQYISSTLKIYNASLQIDLDKLREVLK